MANAVCSSTHTQQLSRSKTTLWAVWGRQAAREARTKDCREAESPRGFAPTLPQATKRAPGSAPVNDWCCRAAGGFAQPKEKRGLGYSGRRRGVIGATFLGGAARDASEASISPASQQCSPRVLKARQHRVHVHVLFGVACCPHDPSARKKDLPSPASKNIRSFFFWFVLGRSEVCVLDLYRQAPFFFFLPPSPAAFFSRSVCKGFPHSDLPRCLRHCPQFAAVPREFVL